MGWCNSEIMDRLQVELENNNVDHECRKKIYIGMIGAMEECDWESDD